MNVYDLTREQMEELKRSYIFGHLEETEGREPSYNELADAESIVPDWIIYQNYAHIDFTADDFYCSMGA